MEADQDDGFDLHYDLEDAAAALRGLGENLHVAVDRMRALEPRHTPGHPAQATAYAIATVPGNPPAPPVAAAFPQQGRR